MDFAGKTVVVTGGTGALGTAVVTRLRMAGAVCHVTNLVAAELETYAHRNDPDVHIQPGTVRRMLGRRTSALASRSMGGGRLTGAWLPDLDR